jgi:2-iminobutanoate/2-iminopropanoate deaminase
LQGFLLWGVFGTRRTNGKTGYPTRHPSAIDLATRFEAAKLFLLFIPLEFAMQVIHCPSAPPAVGPYSHAVRVGNLLFCSGQIPLDPATKQIVPGGIREQTDQVLRNVAAVLDDQELHFANVVKSTIFMTDLSDFPIVNGIYAQAFGDHKPARSTVQVAALPLGAMVEIEVIAEVF